MEDKNIRGKIEEVLEETEEEAEELRRRIREELAKKHGGKLKRRIRTFREREEERRKRAELALREAGEPETADDLGNDAPVPGETRFPEETVDFREIKNRFWAPLLLLLLLLVLGIARALHPGNKPVQGELTEHTNTPTGEERENFTYWIQKEDSASPSELQPVIYTDGLREAAEISGFGFTAPDGIAPYTNYVTNAVQNEFLEELYADEKGNIGYRIRKYLGKTDISGAVTEYREESSFVTDRGISATVRKNEKGEIKVVVWQYGEYSYAIDFEELKISEGELREMIAQVE